LKSQLFGPYGVDGYYGSGFCQTCCGGLIHRWVSFSALLHELLGQKLSHHHWHGGMSGNRSSHLGQRVTLENGNSPTFFASDAGRELVFYRDGKIVHTMPIVLTPGAVNEFTR